MREFFHGWKRKVGCVTLVLACLFAAAWISSLTRRHDVFIPIGGDSEYVVGSALGSLRWVKYSPQIFRASPRRWIRWTSGSIVVPEEHSHDSYWRGYHVAWRINLHDFDFGAATVEAPTCHIARWAIPYWSIVIPLTLLSAWLILSKPRAKAETPITSASENA